MRFREHIQHENSSLEAVGDRALRGIRAVERIPDRRRLHSRLRSGCKHCRTYECAKDYLPCCDTEVHTMPTKASSRTDSTACTVPRLAPKTGGTLGPPDTHVTQLTARFNPALDQINPQWLECF